MLPKLCISTSLIHSSLYPSTSVHIHLCLSLLNAFLTVPLSLSLFLSLCLLLSVSLTLSLSPLVVPSFYLYLSICPAMHNMYRCVGQLGC